MKKLNSLTKKRIFWLGMHKLLVTTELNRLRMLGYEVFNPPYLSSIIDQSAVRDWAFLINISKQLLSQLILIG